MVYQFTNGYPPQYYLDTHVVPQTRTQFGDRSFAVAGPQVWNSLPAPLRETNSIYSVRKLLKTYTFSGYCHA